MMPPTPSETLGELFRVVQERGIFADSKTFADAEPRRTPAAIMADWERETPASDADIVSFVRANFDMPQVATLPAPKAAPLEEFIVSLWPALTRPAATTTEHSSLLALPRPFVVPGGRFRELYYWDSFFTMLGLAKSGEFTLIEDMIANFGSLIDRYGHIPNGTRSYYLSRSHPPVFYLMAAMSPDRSMSARRQRLAWMRREHAFWMAGADQVSASGEFRRVVRLSDGSLLNRYWDDRAAPRDESWREDVELAAATPTRCPQELWRDLRAAAESGWDFSSRWLGDREALGTIRTTRLLPVDLNALLFGLERAIAEEASSLSENAVADDFGDRAARRQGAIERHFWNETRGYFADFDLDDGRVSDQPTAAQAFVLFAGATSPERAALSAQSLSELLRAGGLLTTERTTRQQWDAPNGWAPLQHVAIEGLRRFGQTELADKIADNWLSLVQEEFERSGQLLEKYDVENCRAGGGGEYGTEVGFGWTNGVTLNLLR